MALDEISKIKIEKLELLRKAGVNPYPEKSWRTHEIGRALENFVKFSADKDRLVLAGRVMAYREHGASCFLDLEDANGKIQLFLKKDVVGDFDYDLFLKTIDIGDFLEASGFLMKTKKEEKTLEVEKFRILAKALLPLPEKWHGLQDIEERYRKRYLDILMNPELRDLVIKKSKFWDVVRDFMKSQGFLEVETPTLETTTGGAEATPFKTHHSDYDLDVYLRISIGELWQKRLMAAGFPKTFEIGRAYRNEGTSPEHAQEFTNMEFYWGYANYNDGMELVREMYINIAERVFGTTKFMSQGHTFDLGSEWERIDYV